MSRTFRECYPHFPILLELKELSLFSLGMLPVRGRRLSVNSPFECNIKHALKQTAFLATDFDIRGSPATNLINAFEGRRTSHFIPSGSELYLNMGLGL